jgi:CRP-like cAMP-binding protein
MVTGLWLTPGPLRGSIEPLLLDLLETSVPALELRRAIVEELGRPVKRLEVALEFLGVDPAGKATAETLPLQLVAPRPGRDPWRDALTMAASDGPLGVLIDTADHGRVAVVHEVFRRLGPGQQRLMRDYAALAAAGQPHAAVLEALAGQHGGPAAVAALIADARRQVLVLDPSVLFSPDSDIRVQLGSVSETTRNLLREGIRGEHIFVLPTSLFEERTNYGDVEFLVYLNFFLRHHRRARLVGTASQQAILRRLLTLTIFGIFDPDVPEPPPLRAMRTRWGVADQATHDFLRGAYEMYAVREGPGPDSPVLGVDEYLNFTVIGEEPVTLEVTPAPDGEGAAGAATVTIAARGEAFDVRIALADGRVVDKRLERTASRPTVRPVPEGLVRPLRFAIDRPRFGVTPLGTSHGFDPSGDLTSLVVWIGGQGMVVDPSPEALAYLETMGVAEIDVPYVFLTHVHGDHDGGLLRKLIGGSRSTVIASDVVFRAFAEKARLITGQDFELDRLVQHVSVNPGAPVELDIAGEQVRLETRWNLHPIPTNGFRITVDGRTFGYSADTQYDPALLAARGLPAPHLDRLLHFFWTPEGAPTADLVYHEAGIPPIHTDKAMLGALPEALRERMEIVHIADRDVPPGFSPPKPLLLGTRALLAPTPDTRARILHQTLRLVCYLYDAPEDCLGALLRDTDLREYAEGDVILRQGPMTDEDACFFVVADGEVAVKDGRRVLARLVKGDTFGEWALSDDRRLRSASVVATRPALCLRFTEAQYLWLIEQHPAVQERLDRLRTLLPRLKHAQARARLKVEAHAGGADNVLATMTESQLSSLILFSAVAGYRARQNVIAEGDEADGFYVVLTGRLTATVRGAPVGELGDGDVFGEIGLLRTGRRGATVTVTSTAAEVLFMSKRNFERLLQAVPSFVFALLRTAEGRGRTRAPARRARKADDGGAGA